MLSRVVAFGLVAVVGCGEPCSQVRVRALADDQTPIENANVTWRSVEGADEPCTPDGPGEWLCGEAGVDVVTVTFSSADGSGEADITVTDDTCDEVTDIVVSL